MWRMYAGLIFNVLGLLLTPLSVMVWISEWWNQKPTSAFILMMALLGVYRFIQLCARDARGWRRKILSERSFREYLANRERG